MNKITKITLSILGGVDVIMTISTPILLVLVWLYIFGIQNHWTTYIFLTMGWGASLFRAIKIGFLKND